MKSYFSGLITGTSAAFMQKMFVGHVKDRPAFCPIYVVMGFSPTTHVSLNWNKKVKTTNEWNE